MSAVNARTDDAPAAQLGDLLAQVFDGEPPLGDGVDAVYRRAEVIRRRRLRAVVGAGAAAVVVIAAVGYGLTTAILPASPSRSTGGAGSSAAAAPAPADPVLGVLRSVAADNNYRVVPREPSRGAGWRRYAVVSRDSGLPRGLIEVSAYAAPDGLCFPVLADAEACARPERRGDDVQYVRYADDRDVDWQVNQAIARRLSDGRVIVVMATGERGTGSAAAGRPPLTGLQTATAAADARLIAGFGADERCNGPDPACPVLKVRVPVID
jgi:hypothetical protein